MNRSRLLSVILILFLLIPLSFIPNLFVFPFANNQLSKYYLFAIISILLITYTVFRREKFFGNPFMFLPILFGYIFEIFRNPLIGGINILTVMGFGILLLGTFSCMTLIYNSRKNTSSYDKLLMLLKPYVYFSSFVVVFGVSMYGLNLINIIHFDNWLLPSFYGYEFTNRIDSTVTGYQPDYYLTPFYFSVIQPNYIKLPYPFDLIGTNCGVFIEPHVNSFFITPSFFLLNIFIKRRILLIVLKSLFLIFLVLSLSTTNIISFLVVMFFLIISRILKSNSKILLSISLLIIFTFGFLVLSKLEIVKEIMNLVEIKSTSSSNETSSGYIEHIFSPETFFGTGILVIPSKGDDYVYNDKIIELGDVGIVGFIIFLSHYCILFFVSLRNIFFNPKYYYVGLATLYFGIHSLKIPIHCMQYPFTIYILYILSVTSGKVFFTLKKK